MGGEIKYYLIILSIFALNLLYSQEYCVGDIVSEADQARTFDVCGLYFVQIIAGEYVNTQKIMLIK